MSIRTCSPAYDAAKERGRSHACTEDDVADRTKPEETWRRARLIPTTGIGGQDEQEQRATSSLLAVMGAVPQFGRAILDHVGAPGGRIQTFTEIRFVDEDTRLSIPDGAVVIERGKARWVCLVEVKTAGAELREEQVERYLELARVNGFDAVLTISNQITASPVESPMAIDPKKAEEGRASTPFVVAGDDRGAGRAQAPRGERSRPGVDPRRADRLPRPRARGRRRVRRHGRAMGVGPRRRPRSHAEAFRSRRSRRREPMGAARRLPRARTHPGPRPPGRADVATEDGSGGTAGLARPINGRSRQAAGLDPRAGCGRRDRPRGGPPGSTVPNVDRGRGAEGGSTDHPDQLDASSTRGARRTTSSIEVRYPNQKEPTSCTLKDARAKPERLLYSTDPKREPMSFRVTMSKDLGMKRGRLAGSFVLESKQQTSDFYRSIVQGLRAWAPAAPKLPAAARRGHASRIARTPAVHERRT